MWRAAPLSQVSADKPGHEHPLFYCLDHVSAVVGTGPGDGLVWRMATENGEARQSSSCASIASEASQLHSILGTSAVEQRPQRNDDPGRVIGHTEVRPIEMVARPRRLPPFVQIEPIVRRDLASVGVHGINRHGGDLGAVGQYDDRTVLMHVESLMFVVGISALGWFILCVPVKLALPTCHYRARLGHFRTFAERTVDTRVSTMGRGPQGSWLLPSPYNCLRDPHGLPNRSNRRPAVKLVAQVECFTHPVAEYVIVGTGKDPVVRIVTRDHHRRLPFTLVLDFVLVPARQEGSPNSRFVSSTATHPHSLR